MKYDEYRSQEGKRCSPQLICSVVCVEAFECLKVTCALMLLDQFYARKELLYNPHSSCVLHWLLRHLRSSVNLKIYPGFTEAKQRMRGFVFVALLVCD